MCVNNAAYPLRTISGIRSRWLDPQSLKNKAVKKFIAQTLICLIVAGIASIASVTAGVFLFLGGIATLIWRLTAALKMKRRYVVILDITGAQHHVIWPFDKNEVDRLIGMILEKRAHPDAPQK